MLAFQPLPFSPPNILIALDRAVTKVMSVAVVLKYGIIVFTNTPIVRAVPT